MFAPSARLRRGLVLLGPGFVAAVAYVDPGNFAANISAGARYGYLLAWVIVAANLMAGLVQYLSAKVTLATGRTLPELVRTEFASGWRWPLWIVAELVALATDLAEVIGGAIALQLLFGLPLLLGGVITAVVSYGLLVYRGRRGQRRFEGVILGLLAIISIGFLASTVVAHPSTAGIAHGLVPRLAGPESVALATGMIGATVMPHAIWLHGALVRDRHGAAMTDDTERSRLMRWTRVDVGIAMVLAGLVNLAMLILAAAALRGAGETGSLPAAFDALRGRLGHPAAIIFAVGLLASGLASSSVGTYAGTVILEGFWQRRIPMLVRRSITLIPALVVLAIGIDPSRALVLSQIALSFGIPFALWPLVRLTAKRTVMGRYANGPVVTGLAVLVAVAITGLNVVLLAQTVL